MPLKTWTRLAELRAVESKRITDFSVDRNKLKIKSTLCHGNWKLCTFFCKIKDAVQEKNPVEKNPVEDIPEISERSKRRDYKTENCVDCEENQYNPKSGENIHCKYCSKCEKGSKEVDKCTSTTNTRCKCRKGFTPLDQRKEEICVCKKGSGVDRTGETCSECRYGYFSDKDDSTCQKWRECNGEIEIPGTSISDAICKNAPNQAEIEAPTTYVTSLKTTTISSTAPLRTTASSPTKEHFYSIWLVMIVTGILLLLSGLLYHKCKVTYCIHNHKKVDSRKESICRKPVEESGDKCLSSLV